MAPFLQLLLASLWPSGCVWFGTSLQISEIPQAASPDVYVPEEDVLTVSVKTYPQDHLSAGRGGGDNKTKIVCFGDSITHGLCSGKHGSYPERLQTMLGEDYVVTEFGFCGRSVVQSGENPIWKEKGSIRSAEASLPDIVVIMFGTNDAKEATFDDSEFKSDYTRLIQQFQSVRSSPKVYVMSPPPVYNKAKDIHDAVIRSNINSRRIDILVKDIARENRLPEPIDLFGLFKTECDSLEKYNCPWISHKVPPSDSVETLTCDNDGKHPNDEGYEQIAKRVKQHIS